ncbi:hypothetical protein HPC49_02245 [Pyxidicoccus fallax]|uniref:Uncharacterized protein n=1 Tax=Pyxidicoccus fallax TaxID=394095 RepID=A0A848LCL3_9BACT|nr:hypothetical protein [Pyxidicoccus fallax]NMO14555.1 hypothetical protein [Pyxidicoccus fallax]NPC77074.1 hypothetical protein [Pyxidicoccus fallax]
MPKKASKQQKIRKQVYELTPEDLERCPVWEFASDEEGVEGQDEATVRPRPDLSAPLPRHGLLVVKARFLAKDGSEFIGHCTPGPENEPGALQPAIACGPKQVGFWFGMAQPTRKELASHYKALGKKAEDLFPLKFEAVLRTPGYFDSGVIPAFQSYSPEDRDTVVNRV